MRAHQAGFDFGQDAAPSSFAQPAGTWLTAEFTASEHAARLTAAEACAEALAPALRGLYLRGIEAARSELQRMARHQDAGNAFGLYGVQVRDVTGQELAELLREDSAAEGIERRTRRARTAEPVHSVYVAGAGTITTRVHVDGSRSASYEHYRSADMLPSFRDTMPVYELLQEVWSAAYASQAIAEAGEGIASVKTFRYCGREWVNDGGMYFQGKACCEGWAIVRRSAWDGQTYSYRDQVQAWDLGTLERGDRRGLVVKVQGVECVLVSVASFTAFERAAPEVRPAAEDDEPEPAPEPEEGEEWEPRLESLVRATKKQGIRPFDDHPLRVKRRTEVDGHVLFTCETTGPVTVKKRRNGTTYKEWPQWQSYYEAKELKPEPARPESL
ncbi:MAG: hypothetical protein JSS08_01270 [Proteobacteria bacterium]|nr:hypothetical protein [Pseudomonadota bacterium]